MKETTIKELYEKNPDMRVLIDDEGKVTLKEPTGRWKPEFGEQYWFINSNGYISSSFWEGGLKGDERNRYELSNVFATTSEAKTAGERLRIRAELLDCGGKETFEKSSCRWAIGWSDGHLTPDEWYVQVPHSTFGSIPMSRLKPPLKKWVKKELRNIFLVSRIS